MTDDPPLLVFYDGECGMCHAAVRFLAARDPDGSRFRFAPLGGATFAERVRATSGPLGDSVVVLAEGHPPAGRAAAVASALERLGGIWRLPAWIVRRTPRTLADRCYDAVARRRNRSRTCPPVDSRIRDRFLP